MSTSMPGGDPALQGPLRGTCRAAPEWDWAASARGGGEAPAQPSSALAAAQHCNVAYLPTCLLPTPLARRGAPPPGARAVAGAGAGQAGCHLPAEGHAGPGGPAPPGAAGAVPAGAALLRIKHALVTCLATKCSLGSCSAPLANTLFTPLLLHCRCTLIPSSVLLAATASTAPSGRG